MPHTPTSPADLGSPQQKITSRTYLTSIAKLTCECALSKREDQGNDFSVPTAPGAGLSINVHIEPLQYVDRSQFKWLVSQLDYHISTSQEQRTEQRNMA